VVVRRVYDDGGSGGWRVLVDRLWPRGVTKAAAGLDDWAKDVAPSTELRRWYGHDPERFPEFTRRYLDELAEPAGAAAVADLVERARQGPVVLLTATRDVDRSGARVLADHLAAVAR
jgi:uncharacterized protein YeaO (DUF488 family)